MIASLIRNLLGSKPKYRRIIEAEEPRLIIPQPCIFAVQEGLKRETQIGHEGIAYFLGRIEPGITTVITVVCVPAKTSRGSFEVSSLAMARLVRRASDLGLKVVGQIHTHPGEAYHSDGDEDGARIAYEGYVSIVLPNYGRHLPSLNGAAAYLHSGKVFRPLPLASVTIAPHLIING